MDRRDGRLLVVEDDRATAMLVERLLRRHGFVDVEVATSATEAARACRERAFDVVISDLHMTEGSGFDVLACLHARPSPRPYVLVLSGTTDPELRRRALDLGARDFLAKPFEIAELLARVTRLVETSRSRRSSEILFRSAG